MSAAALIWQRLRLKALQPLAVEAVEVLWLEFPQILSIVE